MDAMNYLMEAFQIILAPQTLPIMLAGVVFGVVMGALPGISCTMAVILALTFTYAMDPVLAITFLCAVNCAAVTGGSITAILFNIPGTPASAVTTFDGGPMVKRGEVGRALSISLFASAFGNLIGAIIMFFCTAPLMIAALKFGASEMCAVVLLGLSIIVFLDEKNMLLTIASGFIGLWIATIGQDPMTGQARYTFGSSFLLPGIDSLPFMIGMFALAELMEELVFPSKSTMGKMEPAKITKLTTWKEMWSMKWLMLRDSILGTIVGILPGAGSTIASFLSYTLEVKLSKTPEKFGTGIPEGIAASESGNNAAAAGMMIPLVAMGIPGGTGAAMMIVALTIQGVQVGPLLMRSQPLYLYSVVAGMLFASIAMVFIALLIAKVFARVFCIPYRYLAGLIFVLALVGCYAKNGRINDVYIMLLAGILGFILKKCNFNTSAIVLGLVLGNLFEVNLRRTIGIATDGLGAYLVTRPITMAILILIVAIYIITFVRYLKRIKKAKAQ